MIEHIYTIIRWYPDRLLLILLWSVLSAVLVYGVTYILVRDKKVTGIRCRRYYFLATYIIALFMITIGSRTPSDGYRLLLNPIDTINIIVAGNIKELVDIVENTILFIPFGAFCYKFDNHNVLKWSALCSISIEVIQLILKLGYFETLDILTNVIGASIGFFICNIVCQLFRK